MNKVALEWLIGGVNMCSKEQGYYQSQQTTGDMTDEEFEEFIPDKIHYFDDVVPRKKPDRVSLWLDTVNQMTACSYCGVVAGSCLGGKENCPKEGE